MTSKQDMYFFILGREIQISRITQEKVQCALLIKRDKIESDKMSLEIEVRLQKGFDRIATYCRH